MTIFIALPYLPATTIVPDPSNLPKFYEFFNRLYEDIAINVNERDFIFFPIGISDTASNIPNIPPFGAFIVCISGTEDTLPTITASLCKSTSTSSGQVVVLGSQAGSGDWAGITLTISSTTDSFQVNHNLPNMTASFNIRIIGTQVV